MGDLQRMIKQAREQEEELRELFDEVKEEQDTLHVLVLGQLMAQLSLLTDNLKANAELFNKAVGHAERDLRLELDRLYRGQRSIVEKLLEFPARPFT